MRAPGLGRKAALAILLLVVAAAAVQSARSGASGLHAQQAHAEIERWTSRRIAPDAGAIAAVDALLERSLSHAPANPEALGLKGTLELARMRASHAPREARAAAQRARGYYRQALVERPTSPFLWANLAFAKLYLDEFDAEMFAALRNADALGPWEPAVQQSVVFVGLAGWRKVDAGLRESLARTVERAGQRSANAMYQVVKDYGRFDLVCKLVSYRTLAAGNCGGTAAGAGKDRG